MNTKRIEMIKYGVTGDRHAPSDLAECIAEFTRVLEAIPSEFRYSAAICFEPYWAHGESYSQVQIDYERPMTPAELMADAKEMRQHWLDQISEAKKRVAICERELAAVNAVTQTNLVAA